MVADFCVCNRGPADSVWHCTRTISANGMVKSPHLPTQPGVRMTFDPLAYFITWTVYGTHLQGDENGWKKRRDHHQLPQPRLEQWRRERLNHPVLMLTTDQRLAVENVIRAHSDYRDWKLWAVSCRSNHVHVVVTAQPHSGKQVRDQFKANATRVLRESWQEFAGRPVWTVGGDWQCINTDEDLETVTTYVSDAQHRMHLPK